MGRDVTEPVQPAEPRFPCSEPLAQSRPRRLHAFTISLSAHENSSCTTAAGSVEAADSELSRPPCSGWVRQAEQIVVPSSWEESEESSAT